MRHGRGCAAAPVLAVGAPFVAASRALTRGRRGGALRLSLRRAHREGVAVLTAELAAPLRRTAEIAAALGTGAGEIAVHHRLTVGTIGVTAGEEPLLVARAPRRDLVADAFERALTADRAHLAPALWVVLEPGHFLAEVAAPYAPFDFDEGALTAHVVRGTVRLAALVTPRRTVVESVLLLGVYGSSADVRSAFAVARNALATLPGWETASETAP